MRARAKVLVGMAGGLLPAFAGPALAQETCADRLDRIEASLADADLPAGQREDMAKVLQGARDLATAGEEDSCQKMAGTLDQLRTSLAVTDEVEAMRPGPPAGGAAREAPPAGAAGAEPGGGLTAPEAERLIGAQVVDRDGDPVGELVDVARLQARDQHFAVVRYGGLLGFGERDAMVLLAEVEPGEAGEVVLSRAAASVLDELPEYDRATFESLTGRLK
jgi:hypothetical protein